MLYIDAMEFIPPKHIPTLSKIKYASFVCYHCPLKSELWRMKLVIGDIQMIQLLQLQICWKQE